MYSVKSSYFRWLLHEQAQSKYKATSQQEGLIERKKNFLGENKCHSSDQQLRR